jgi:hypothetical protein
LIIIFNEQYLIQGYSNLAGKKLSEAYYRFNPFTSPEADPKNNQAHQRTEVLEEQEESKNSNSLISVDEEAI